MRSRHATSSSISSASLALPSRFIVPPMPPQIHRRLMMTIGEDGLSLRPKSTDVTISGVLIRWGVRGKVEVIPNEIDRERWADRGELDGDGGVELGGILGIVRLWDAAYLLVFLPPTKAATPLFPDHTGPDHVDDQGREATASRHSVHKLGGIHPIPLVPDLARQASAHLDDLLTKRLPKKSSTLFTWSDIIRGLNVSGPGAAPSELQEPEDSENDSESTPNVSQESLVPEADESLSDSKAIERFSLAWRRLKLGKPTSSTLPREAPSDSDTMPVTTSTLPPIQPQRRELETKIIRQITREFSAGTFFYSFDFDLTHSLQHKRRRLTTRIDSSTALAKLLLTDDVCPPRPGDDTADEGFVEPDVHIPLWRRVDRRFFWNEWLLKDFLDLGLHAYVLPVMQGWVQSSTFTVPVPPAPRDVVPVDLVVISRRSRDRAGLRYQRRGIDDEGNVANMIETEMIVLAKVERKVSLFSFVQVRGSIPLKWSQSPYSMKPPPILDQPVEKSFSIANSHFNDLTARYGPITVINLSEQSGKEGVVTNGYRDLLKSLARKDLVYKDFDFHAKCHGMKWENISELVEGVDLNGMGYLWTLQGDAIREQTGAFRANCIDCLDRTNVVQSAIARQVLSTMLTQLGLIPDATTSNIERVFNDIWANNGDTLSLCYAHTSALKGDFVRTGKRDLSGMLHDGFSSISRMFYGAVSDFFAQAVISFMLGHRNLSVFSEFLENLQSSEESNLIQLSRVRAAAIETSSARVLSDGEQRVAGWTLLSPEDRNVKLSPKLEEKVLILTEIAIYVVSFNYSLEKVIRFTRIPLTSLTSLSKGAYILSTLQEAGRDPVENSGFVIAFSPIDESTRYSTYSIRNKSPSSPMIPGTPIADIRSAQGNPLASEFYAFKVLPREFMHSSTAEDDDSGAESGETCRAVAEGIVSRIVEQYRRLRPGLGEGVIISEDVVSLTEAQQSTSLLSRMDYAVKRFLWL